MKKTWEEQNKDIWAKEEKKAKSLGFSSVEDYRKHCAVENRKKTYQAKIARYKEAIKEMEEYIASH